MPRLMIGLLAVAVAVVGTGCSSDPQHHGPAQPPASLGTAFNQALPASILNLPLQEADGQLTTLAAFKGEPVMIADFLSLCTDICPLISANTVEMAKTLSADGDKAALLEISVDPRRDTPARLRAYQKLYGGPHPNWTLLRATPTDTRIFWRALHVSYFRTKEGKPAAIDWWTGKKLTYDIAHEDALIFLDSSLHERFVIDAAADTQGAYPPAKLAEFLDKQGAEALTKPVAAASWTVPQGLSVIAWLLGKAIPEPQA